MGKYRRVHEGGADSGESRLPQGEGAACASGLVRSVAALRDAPYGIRTGFTTPALREACFVFAAGEKKQ